MKTLKKTGCVTWLVGLLGAFQIWIGIMGAATHEEILGEKYDPKWAAGNVVIGTLLLTLAVSFGVKHFNPDDSDK